MRILELSGITPEVTYEELEAAIVLAADGDVFDALWFDEEDGSYFNFRTSTLIQPPFSAGSPYPISMGNGTSYQITPDTPLSEEGDYAEGYQIKFRVDTRNTVDATLQVDDNQNSRDLRLYPDAEDNAYQIPEGTFGPGKIITVTFYSPNFYLDTVEVDPTYGVSANAQPTRIQSETQGWMNIINAMASLRQQYLATPFPKE